MNWRPFSINDALADPGRVFGSPENIVSDPRLDRSSKIKILRRWQDRFRQANAAEATQDDANALQARLQQAIDRLRQNGKR